MDEWMECQANMHKYKNMSMVVYMHIFVCVHGLISLSHILTPSKVNTIFKHSWHTIQKLFQMWIYSLELEFHPLHTQSVSFIHSLTRSFIHWRWAPSFFVYSLYKKSYKNICRNAYWNQMLRTVENTVIQRYFSPFLVVVHIPCTSACVCIRMRHNGLFAVRVQCVTYKTSQILYEVERTVVMNEWMNVEYILGAIEKERGFYSTRPIHTKYKNTCIFSAIIVDEYVQQWMPTEWGTF